MLYSSKLVRFLKLLDYLQKNLGSDIESHTFSPIGTLPRLPILLLEKPKCESICSIALYSDPAIRSGTVGKDPIAKAHCDLTVLLHPSGWNFRDESLIWLFLWYNPLYWPPII